MRRLQRPRDGGRARRQPGRSGPPGRLAAPIIPPRRWAARSPCRPWAWRPPSPPSPPRPPRPPRPGRRRLRVKARVPPTGRERSGRGTRRERPVRCLGAYQNPDVVWFVRTTTTDAGVPTASSGPSVLCNLGSHLEAIRRLARIMRPPPRPCLSDERRCWTAVSGGLAFTTTTGPFVSFAPSPPPHAARFLRHPDLAAGLPQPPRRDRSGSASRPVQGARRNARRMPLPHQQRTGLGTVHLSRGRARPAPAAYEVRGRG